MGFIFGTLCTFLQKSFYVVGCCVRKRKSPSAAAATETLADVAKRPCINGAGDMTATTTGVTARDDNTDQDQDECVDDKESMIKTLIVRLPTQAPNALATDVIVIDDSDDDENDTMPRPDNDTVPPPSSDIKPDVQQLDRQLTEPAASADDVDQKPSLTDMMTDQSDRANALQQSSSASLGHGVDTADSGTTVEASSSSHSTAENGHQPAACSSTSSTARLSSPSHHRFSKSAVGKSSGKKLQRNKHQQTEVVTQDAGVQSDGVDAGCGSTDHQQKLESLRGNVLQLLKTIVPTLTCNNLEFVDELVVEMVRVNAESNELDN